MIIIETHENITQQSKKEKGILKAIGSIILAVLVSSHHWLHTLLIMLGLTTLGTGLFAMSPTVKIIFMVVSLIVSVLMVRTGIRKWKHHRSVSWVYLISSVISIIIVLIGLFQVTSNIQPNQQNQKDIEHQQHHQN